MSFTHSTFRKPLGINKLIILNAVPEDEQQTALHLDEYLHDISVRQGVSLIRVNSAKEFIENLELLIDSFRLEMGFRPIIHIEAHGSPTVIEFPDKSFLHWSEVAKLLRVINFHMNNTLTVFIATCHAVHYLHINHTIHDFAPAYLCISPKESIFPSEIEEASCKFYKNFFETGDMSLACNSLDIKKFFYYNSDFIFHKSFLTLITTLHKGKGFAARKEELISLAVSSISETWDTWDDAKKSAFLKRSRQYLKMELRSKESIKRYFDFYSTQFLGYARDDIFEEIFSYYSQNYSL
ncbi:hypothetical protein [Pantoea dispersa]|uniref:hypothetical protein n=1 Tax=Pantoea dispersa TaxID=59814 RepID=UPI0021F77B1B|nr:hypothetical protein [Pantoea dispersa]UYP73343.1 hypothetical protein OF384_18985 [Pantoea dispersa]